MLVFSFIFCVGALKCLSTLQLHEGWIAVFLELVIGFWVYLLFYLTCPPTARIVLGFCVCTLGGENCMVKMLLLGLPFWCWRAHLVECT